jgi:hypothetical protein
MPNPEEVTRERAFTLQRILVEEHGVPSTSIDVWSWGRIVAVAAGWCATEAAHAELFFTLDGRFFPSQPPHYPSPTRLEDLRRVNSRHGVVFCYDENTT